MGYFRYDPKHIAKELRGLADLLDNYDDGLAWGNLIILIEKAKDDLRSKGVGKKIVR